MARALEMKLTHEGFRVMAVFDGEAALAVLLEQKIDLLILDLVMPKMDGFSVLRHIKEKGIALPVVVLSNLSQIEDEKKAKELGAREFCIKSDTPIAEIVKKVKQILPALSQ